ncbi:ABC transporter ATP-binding protein [Brevibacterium aurantiacum]|uniref:ABC transporter ATP-binding protein n=1 Tax=Brevibacterium aurantiacum TaxID=273384 RepID=UPI000DF2E46F|nr:ABC transporter ATP-binding protein [Brevibacterium aurantiacum]RCS84257.1 ABC transporter ATP-binding protein [Brevibacterium aurantiacum]
MTVLQARSVSKTFDTTDPPTPVLKGIDLDVAEAEFLVIMGASGSGKSTLLYALSGLDRPTEGIVTLAGRDLTGLSEKEASQMRLHQVGFIFQQSYFLDNLSIRDNILLPALKAAGTKDRSVSRHIDDLLERFGIGHIANHGITEASGDQLQRASICRALSVGPQVLFADEPTGALNSSMTEDVMDAISSVHDDGTTIIMVTHDPVVAARADRVIYLRDGELIDELHLSRVTETETRSKEDELQSWLSANDF